jgi:general secretion pathway protein G
MQLFLFRTGRRNLLFTLTLALIGVALWAGCSRSKPEKYPMQMVKPALGMFAVDCGHYPTTAEGLEVLLKLPNNTSITNWHGPYAVANDLKDPWGHEYIYRCPGIHNIDGYDLSSMGPDGKEGTDDDIGNWLKPGE